MNEFDYEKLKIYRNINKIMEKLPLKIKRGYIKYYKYGENYKEIIQVKWDKRKLDRLLSNSENKTKRSKI